MPKRSHKLGEHLKSSKPRRSVAASFGGATNGFITLPQLSKSVPVQSVSTENEMKWLEAAKLCAELVEDDVEFDIPEDKISARDIIKHCLSVWANKQCANIQLLDNFSLTASLDDDGFFLDSEYCQDEEKEDRWFMVLTSMHNTPHINVRAKLDAFEATCPRLASTVIHYLEQASFRTCNAFTPRFGEHQASHIWWQGMESDDDLISEIESMGDSIEEWKENSAIPLPSEFISQFPEYMASCEALSKPELETLSLRQDTEGETAKVILSIMDLIDKEAVLPGLGDSGYYAEPVYFSCYLSACKDGEVDGMVRIIDDFYEQTSYGDGNFTDIYGISRLAFDKKSFLKWKDEMEKGFALYTQLDRLLQLVGERKEQ